MNRNPLIIALDVESREEARQLVRKLGDGISIYKVGMELYAAAGMDYVRELMAEGKEVFLDLKLYDIGETVRRAVAQVAKAGARFLTVHGSRAVMAAAREGKADAALQLLAVTVLTSFDEDDLRSMGYPCSPADLVSLRVTNARAAGLDGIVCSPLEVAAVRKLAGPEAVLVTPGVRSTSADAGDQKRVSTPAEALRNGADYLVIGRQISRAPDPALALAALLQEVDAAR